MSQRIPANCAGLWNIILSDGPEILFEVFARGVKYILPTHRRDERLPLNAPAGHACTQFTDMQNWFYRFDSGQMEQRDLTTVCLKELVRYERGLSGRVRRRTRRKRAMTFAKDIRKMMRGRGFSRAETRCIAVFALSVRNAYLPR